MIDTKAVRALADDVEKHWAINRAYETLRQCADEIDAMKEDAERYRWLRNDSINASWKTPTVTAYCPDGINVDNVLDGERLDDAIDRARKGTT